MREPGQLIPRIMWAGAWALLLAGPLSSVPWAADEPAALSVCDQARRMAADGRVKQAVELLDQAAAAGHRTTELYDLRAQLQLGLGDVDAAERDWRRAAQLDPTNSRSRLQLARLHAQRGLWADAIAYYREILLVDPRNADAVLGLAEAYGKSGRTVGAQNLLQAASDSIDDRRIHERWARVAGEAGRPQDAERALRKIAASAEGPAKRDALLRLAELALAQDKPQEALAAVREALSAEQPSGAASEATYDVIVFATDSEIGQVGQGLRATLEALDARSLTREEAFAATQALRARVAEAEQLLREVGAPDSRSEAQARRLFAYTLASEAALNALASIDLGQADRREAFAARLGEAQDEIGRLSPASRRPRT